MSGPKVGVLALQGAFAEHAAALESLGAHAVEVRQPEALAGVDALVLPGGESTTMSMLLTSSGLFEAIGGLIAQGTPVMGTCAGLILLATEVGDGRPDQRSFAALDVAVLRNGYGRQRDSFETRLDITGMAGDPFTAVFIRAPRVSRVGAGVDVLASVGDDPVLVRQGRVLAAAFHPELSGDLRLHQMFLGGI
ncbi:MAG: pyridoxal 5'-phosphate synthase glutaminase subunit PdxT [Acidimicrobiales bacterium]